MTRQTVVSILLALVLAGCTSMRVTGDISDVENGDVISTCGITIGPKYVKVDSAGHFTVNARKWWKKMDVVCAGYESQVVMVDSSKTRYPKLKIQMSPRRTTKARVGPGAVAAVSDPDVVHSVKE